MRSRSKEKSPAAPSRGSSSVQRVSRSEPGAPGARKRAAPRSGVRAKPKAVKASGRAAQAVITEPTEPPVRSEDSIAAKREPGGERDGSGVAALESCPPKDPTVYQRMYAEACRTDSDGRVSLDTERFARALAETTVGVLAEQQLYHLGVLAAAEDQAALFVDDVVAALSV